MKFVSIEGNLPDSSYIKINIADGKNGYSIGDQIWVSKDGTEMEVLEDADDEVLQEASEMFEGGSRLAFKGALRRMGVTWGR